MIELFYVIFLFSGLIKAYLAFFGLDLAFIDFTLLCGLLLLAWYLLHFFRHFFFGNKIYLDRSGRALVFIIAVFYVWMIVTLLYTRSPGYSYTKIFMFLTVLLAVVFPFVYRGFSAGRFFYLFAYVGSGLIGIFTALFPYVYTSYLSDIEYRSMVVKYLDIGYLAGITILVLAFACPGMHRMIKLLLIGFNTWTIIVSAARGPMLFLGFVLLIKLVVSGSGFLKKSWRWRPRNLVYALAGLGILGIGVFYFLERYTLLLERSFSRLLSLFDPQYSASLSERMIEISFSLEKIFASVGNFLFGLGIGSFGIMYEGVDERLYPHNVVLEIGFEMGIIGVILFALLILVYIVKIRFHLNFVLIFVYLLLNSLKSYSLVDLRVMFGVLGVLILLGTQAGKSPVTGEQVISNKI